MGLSSRGSDGAALVSIMVPAYNASGSVRFALASLLAQTFGDWEAIVVDDGSLDGTARIVKAIKDPRVRLVRLRRNRGRGYARQVALAHAQGRFLAMLDADDWWYPWKLQAQLEVLEGTPEAVLVSSAMMCVGADGCAEGVSGIEVSRDKGRPRALRVRSLFSPFPPHAPGFVRMEAAKNVGYEADLVRAEDFVFLRRLLRKAPFVYIGRPLYVYTRAVSFQREQLSTRYRWSARAAWRVRQEYPFSAPLFVLGQLAKVVLWRAGLLGERPLRSLSEWEQREFDEARAAVEEAAFALCGP